MISRKTPAILTVLLLTFGVSYLAVANMGPNESRLINYTGRLETGTTPAQGMHDFRFALFTSAPNDAALDCLLAQPANCGLWVEERLGTIEVQSGHFSVRLGEVSSISDAVLGQNQLWLGIAVRETGTGTYSKLNGSQRIIASPLASRAASAKDFKITGTATVGATLTVGTDTYVGRDLDVTRDLDVDRNMWVTGTSSTTGDAAVKGSLRVGSATPGPWADGYLVVNQGAHFRCASCGSASDFEGSADWGTLNVHGRVLSASANIHLSPPGGSNVIIDDTYRSAGGANTGGAGLDVEGDVTVGGTLSTGHILHTCPYSNALGVGYGNATCACPSGYSVLSGGAKCQTNWIYESRPVSTTQWRVGCAAGNNWEYPKWIQNMTLICARIE